MSGQRMADVISQTADRFAAWRKEQRAREAR